MSQEIHPDWALIQKLGGPAAVARELKLPETSGTQTVQNWKYRGIPPRVKVDRPDLFMPELTAKVPLPAADEAGVEPQPKSAGAA